MRFFTGKNTKKYVSYIGFVGSGASLGASAAGFYGYCSQGKYKESYIKNGALAGSFLALRLMAFESGNPTFETVFTILDPFILAYCLYNPENNKETCIPKPGAR